jgi:hypothetical protein
MHVRRRLSVVPVVGIVACLVAVLGLAPAADAGVPQKTVTVSKPYTRNWVFRSTKLHKCAFIQVSGRITGTHRYAYYAGDGSSGWNTSTLNWSNIHLDNPTVSVQGWPISGAGCDSTKRWALKADISQGWQQSKCSLTVSVGAGFPWSVSASPSYTCGKSRVGHFSSTEGFAKTVHQYNSGTPLHFSGMLAPTKSSIPFTEDLIVRVHTKSASDLFAVHVPVAYLSR